MAQSDALQHRHVARITKALNCRWADPSAAPEDAAAKVELSDGMLEITYGSGVTVTTLGGPVTYQLDSADTVSLSRGLLVVMTPPISSRVATCIGPHGPCFAAAPWVRARLPLGGGNPSCQAASPPAAAHSLFRIRTPSLTVTGRDGAAFCVMVENATTTLAGLMPERSSFRRPAGREETAAPAAAGQGPVGIYRSDAGRRAAGDFRHGRIRALHAREAPAEDRLAGLLPGRHGACRRPEIGPRLLNGPAGSLKMMRYSLAKSRKPREPRHSGMQRRI